MVGNGFGDYPSVLNVEFGSHGNHCHDRGNHSCLASGYPQGSFQVVPFHKESVYCFVDNPSYCNANNVQRIDSTAAPEPEPPTPEFEPATLPYTTYHNKTGVLTLVFDDLVVVHNPDRIHLIRDIDAFIEDEEPPGLDGVELNTADNKRQSMMLAFTLPDAMRLRLTESLWIHGDPALLIDTYAVYAAEGFVDITGQNDNSPILIPNITVVR